MRKPFETPEPERKETSPTNPPTLPPSHRSPTVNINNFEHSDMSKPYSDNSVSQPLFSPHYPTQTSANVSPSFNVQSYQRSTPKSIMKKNVNSTAIPLTTLENNPNSIEVDTGYSANETSLC